MAFKKTSMTIFTKMVSYSTEIHDLLLENTSKSISSVIDGISDRSDFESYDDAVLWALDICRSCPPSPFSVKHGYTLNLGPNYFTLTIPNEFRIGIKYISRGGDPKYKIDIIYMTDIKAMENTTEYKDLVANGWSVDSVPSSKLTTAPAPVEE